MPDAYRKSGEEPPGFCPVCWHRYGRAIPLVDGACPKCAEREEKEADDGEFMAIV